MNAQHSEQFGPSQQPTQSGPPEPTPSANLPTVSEDGAAHTSKERATPDATSSGEYPLIHDHLGKYQLIAELDRGGMGIVFKASDPEGNTVALKTVRRDRIKETEFAQRFAREVHA